MFKRISCLTLCLILVFGICVQQVVAAGNEIEIPDATNSTPTEVQEIKPAAPALYVNDTIVGESALVYRNEIPYVALRYVTMALRPDATVTWTGEYARITAEGLEITVDPDLNYVVCNGRYLYLPDGVFYENGLIRIPAQTMAKIFDAEYSLDPVTNNIELTTGTGSLVSGSEFYNKDDLYWLSHIIYAESGNQPLEGKIAVGNVVLNRVEDPIFPNSIYGVIFQKNQFSPVKNGTINLTPNEESVLAAKLCLDGAVVLPTALWFNSAKSNSWASRHKTYITTIGGHAFYV